MTIFDVIEEWVEETLYSVWDTLFNSTATYLRIFRKRRRSIDDRKVNKRDIVILPSFGIAGEIANDMANTIINALTVWKYQ